jgi:hypothetical protein
VAGLLASFTLGCAASRPVQHAPDEHRPQHVPAELRLSADEARADLESLYRSLQSAHYDLYVHRSKPQYDAYYGQIATRLAQPMTRLDLVRVFQPFVAFGNIGHARIEFPVADYIRAAQEGGTILPLDIRIDDGRVFVTQSYLEDSRIRPGVELLAFGERPIGEIVAEVSRFVSGERPYMVHAQLERFFPRWLWVMRGDVGELRVTARTGGEGSFVETIRGLPIGAVESRKSDWTESLSGREVRIVDEQTAYLRPGPFYNVDGGDSMDPASFARFVDDAFRQILTAKSRTLLVDLRDNPGGDNSFSDLMVALFASRPFRFSDNFSIKASPEIRRQFEESTKEPEDADGIVAQMARAIRDRKDGETVRIDLPRVSPRQDRFRGDVFVLVNRHSYSNAASVAGMVQDYRFARIIGEETADLPTSYASSAQFTLPHSGLAVTYPKGYFVRPSGDESLRGVVPDFTIPRSVFLEGHDAVLRAALAIARTEQK